MQGGHLGPHSADAYGDLDAAAEHGDILRADAQRAAPYPDASSSHDELRVNAIDQAWVQTAIDVGRHEPAFSGSELIPHFLGDERKQVRLHYLLWCWDVQAVCVQSLLHLFSLSLSQSGRGGRLLAIITLLFLWRKYSIYSSQP